MKYPKATKETPAENSEHDFSEYMWMAEEGVENFDRQNTIKARIDRSEESKCRMCGQADEAINYILTECPKMAQKISDDMIGLVENELWEEMFIEACFEEMLAEEEQWFYPEQNSELADMLQGIHLSEEFTEERIKNSLLNPNAPEFIPRWCKNTSVTN